MLGAGYPEEVMCFGPWGISRSLSGRTEESSQKKKNWEKRIRDEKVHGILGMAGEAARSRRRWRVLQLLKEDFKA